MINRAKSDFGDAVKAARDLGLEKNELFAIIDGIYKEEGKC